VEGQADWLMHRTLPERAPPRGLTEVGGDDAVAVRDARRMAQICLGGARTARDVDDYLVACWRDRVPAEQILARAHERPERPVLTPCSWEWRGEAEPASLGEGMARLDALQQTLRGLTPAVARAWALLVDDGTWAERYDSVEDCASEVLGLSLRQSQRLARLGRTLVHYPEIDRAVREGLPVGAAELLGRHGPSANTLERWIALARGVGPTQLARAVAEARWDARPTLEAHAAVARIAAATSPGARVALAQPEPPVTREALRCVPELVPAARWWVETVRLPTPRGFAAVKTRDGYRCRNPECGRVSIRNEAHHIVFRSEGGTDCPDTNGITVCRPCHLRLVHAGRLTVERLEVGEAVLRWTWSDGRSVIERAPGLAAGARRSSEAPRVAA